MSPRTAHKTQADDDSPLRAIPGTVTLNVLGYLEDGEWVALALEMDLRGYGQSFKEALEELTDLVATQIRFAQFKGQAELVWKSSEPVWFERFADVRRERLNALVQDREPSDLSYDVACLMIPPAHSAGALKSEFLPVEA
jgi:hypothetical protein